MRLRVRFTQLRSRDEVRNDEEAEYKYHHLEVEAFANKEGDWKYYIVLPVVRGSSTVVIRVNPKRVLMQKSSLTTDGDTRTRERFNENNFPILRKVGGTQELGHMGRRILTKRGAFAAPNLATFMGRFRDLRRKFFPRQGLVPV